MRPRRLSGALNTVILDTVTNLLAVLLHSLVVFVLVFLSTQTFTLVELSSYNVRIVWCSRKLSGGDVVVMQL